jgi:hypothetical protein
MSCEKEKKKKKEKNQGDRTNVDHVDTDTEL